MSIIELAVTSCLHLVRSNLTDLLPTGIGSGVIIKYKERYFICTVAHFSDRDMESVGVVTGRVKDGQTEVFYYGDFSYLTQITYEEDLMNAEDLIYCLENPERSGNKLDIAFREIELLENLVQEERSFPMDNGETYTVSKGAKSYLVVDEDYSIDTTQVCFFYGRIRPDLSGPIFNFQEQLYSGLSIAAVGEYFIEMDLGEPVADGSRFKGCSGAPVIDSNGRIIGLVTHGQKDLTKPYIYAFRFDKLKQWIDLMYFQEPISNF